MSSPDEPDYGGVLEDVVVAAVNAARWDRRVNVGDAQQRRAAHDAVSAIDAAIRKLHAIRASLVADIRRTDDASMDQLDAFDTYRDNVKATTP
jgi:flagellin-like hook-associated protein FlgL